MKEHENAMQGSFITLAMSIASSAAISLGLAPNPESNKVETNLELARFNIDLLNMLTEKTKGNLLKEEDDFLKNVLGDLQIKYVEVSSRERKT